MALLWLLGCQSTMLLANLALCVKLTISTPLLGLVSS